MSRRVLVVDDDRHMVKTLCDLLRLREWQADSAYSGKEAVAALGLTAYDVVLMDIKMPDLDGVATFLTMKSRHPAVQVVLMTAYAAHERLVEAERAGVRRVLSKPVPPAALLRQLEEVLRQRRSVLVVDDDPAFARTLSDALRTGGFLVAEAHSVDEARELLRREVPTITLLDVHLHDLEPAEAVATLKRLSPGSVLVLYSGYPQMLDQTVAALPPEWVYASLQKPFPLDRLTRLLGDLLTV
jgi:DNA-binding NtrC family response regulator